VDPAAVEAIGGAVLAGGALLAGGSLVAARYLSPPPVVGIPVLRYRLVGRPIPGSPINDLRLPVSKFEAHVKHMRRRGFVPVTLQEAVARCGERAFRKSNPVVLTFEGPYECFASVAWPILTHHRFHRVTLLYPAAYLGETTLVFSEGRPEPLLSTQVLRHLVREGLELGVQVSVKRGDTEAQLLNELTASRKALADVAGGEPTSLSYPFPLPAAVSAAREAGYTAGAVLGDGILTPDGSQFAVPRFAVQPDTELIQLAMILGRRVGSSTC
jgi:hypothetical protein